MSNPNPDPELLNKAGALALQQPDLVLAAPDMLAALKECRRVLGIRNDFAPLGPAVVLAPFILDAIAKAEGRTKS